MCWFCIFGLVVARSHDIARTLHGQQPRAFDGKVESTIVDSHDGANRIQDPPTGTKGPVMNGEALFRRFA
jgi:hypothetical protein